MRSITKLGRYKWTPNCKRNWEYGDCGIGSTVYFYFFQNIYLFIKNDLFFVLEVVSN